MPARFTLMILMLISLATFAGAVTMHGNPVTLVGPTLQVGDAAPAFTAVANDFSSFEFQPASGKVWIIASVPSLDTNVCSNETHHFNQEASKLAADVRILTISMDLPFAQKRWCGAEGVMNLQTISDFRDRQFGQRYGVQIKENGLLARTVFVIDRQGKIAYVQIVPELTHEPDYAPVLDAAKKAAGNDPTTQPTP
ncbi:MAG TPA: thiol peroxidase [Tepidisphaeraceae bacterium]|nr:thiol peroxidase [Tepidisphaeraceae bacterium]